jgi:hypothetical protein
MPSPSPDSQISLWFWELDQFQAACISTDAEQLSPLLAFGNATITNYLKTAATQNNFLTSVGKKTGYKKLAIVDLTTFKTFRGLLDHCHLLETAVYFALRAASDAPAQNIPSKAYYATPVATAFPGKSTGALWLAAQALLMASMDPSCYSLPQRIKVNAIVDQPATTTGGVNKPASTMGDVIKQIVVLG